MLAESAETREIIAIGPIATSYNPREIIKEPPRSPHAHRYTIISSKLRPLPAPQNIQRTLSSPQHGLETSRLGRGRDTRLFSLVGPAQCALTSRVDGTHRLDLSLGLFVVLPLLDTRVSVRFGSSRGETTVLLDRTSERTRTVGRFRLCKCASTGRTRRAGQLIVRKRAE
jgi:hypothetical protein